MIYIHKSNNQNIPPWLNLNIYVDFILFFILKDIMGYSGLASLKHSLKITRDKILWSPLSKHSMSDDKCDQCGNITIRCQSLTMWVYIMGLRNLCLY